MKINFANVWKQLKKPEHLWLAAIFILGTAFRFFYIHFGLPRLYLEDEEFFVTPALRVAGGQINPDWFGTPAQPLIYYLGLVFRTISTVINHTQGTALASWQNYAAHTAAFQIAGRVFPIVLGSLSILAIYFVVRHWNMRSGLIAAVLLAFSFYHVDQSHIIRPDVAQMFFILLMLYFFLRLLDDHRNWWLYVLSGASLGLAFNMKYPSMFFLAPAVLVVWMLWREKNFVWRGWLAWAVGGLAASFVTGPFLYLDFPKVMHDLRIEDRAEHGGHDGFSFFGNLWWYLRDIMPWELGTFVYVLAAGVVAWVVWRLVVRRRAWTVREKKLALLVFTAMSYLLAVSYLKLHWARWIMPVMVLGFALAGVGLDAVLQRLRGQRVAMVLVIALVAAGPAMRLVRMLHGYSQVYTIEQARTWVLENVPVEGTYFLTEPYTPVPKDVYKTYMAPNVSWYDMEYYRGLGLTHFTTSETVYGTIAREAERLGPNSKYGKAIVKYNAIFAESELLYESRPHPEYTLDELLYAGDFSVLQTWRYDIRLGPITRVYRFLPDVQK